MCGLYFVNLAQAHFKLTNFSLFPIYWRNRWLKFRFQKQYCSIFSDVRCAVVSSRTARKKRDESGWGLLFCLEQAGSWGAAGYVMISKELIKAVCGFSSGGGLLWVVNPPHVAYCSCSPARAFPLFSLFKCKFCSVLSGNTIQDVMQYSKFTCHYFSWRSLRRSGERWSGEPRSGTPVPSKLVWRSREKRRRRRKLVSVKPRRRKLVSVKTPSSWKVGTFPQSHNSCSIPQPNLQILHLPTPVPLPGPASVPVSWWHLKHGRGVDTFDLTFVLHCLAGNNKIWNTVSQIFYSISPQLTEKSLAEEEEVRRQRSRRI